MGNVCDGIFLVQGDPVWLLLVSHGGATYEVLFNNISLFFS